MAEFNPNIKYFNIYPNIKLFSNFAFSGFKVGVTDDLLYDILLPLIHI